MDMTARSLLPYEQSAHCSPKQCSVPSGGSWLFDRPGRLGVRIPQQEVGEPRGRALPVFGDHVTSPARRHPCDGLELPDSPPAIMSPARSSSMGVQQILDLCHRKEVGRLLEISRAFLR
jgi:hypothetical protein